MESVEEAAAIALRELVIALIRDAHAEHPRRWPERLAAMERRLRAEGLRATVAVSSVDDDLSVIQQKSEMIREALEP